MQARFYIDTSLAEVEVPGCLRLAGKEAHHLQTVLRIRQGETVTLFDGLGSSGVARVAATERGRVALDLLAVATEDAPPASRVTLATAVPKTDRGQWLVEKATELGVERWIPVLTERSTVNPGAGRLKKLRATVIEACKQCGRDRLLRVEEPVPLLQLLGAEAVQSKMLVADVNGASWSGGFVTAQSPVLALVGPEGGLTAAELEACLAAGAQPVALGPRTLRVETAAVALAALCLLGRGP
jgi:16S rRNA (uracil1498-N3)-methyltransferase